MSQNYECPECEEIVKGRHDCHGRVGAVSTERRCNTVSCNNLVFSLSDDLCGYCKAKTEEAYKLKIVDAENFPLRPLEDLVFVKRAKNDTMTKGGLILPGQNNDSPKTSGLIIAVGPGKWYPEVDRVIRPLVNVGQRVVFSRHANMSIDIEGLIPKDGEEYLVMHADELIAVITGECNASLAPEPAPKIRTKGQGFMNG